MQSPAWYLSRLRSMSAGEIVWRVRSLISANIDLIRIPLGLVPKLDAREMAGPAEFHPGFACSPVGDSFREQRAEAPFRAWAERLTATADAIVANRLTFFDLEDQFVGDPVDWHRDFSAAKSTSRKLSNLIDYRDFAASGDCKLVWEPNRHHQFVILARAWRVTGERHYAQKVVDLMLHWIDENPFGYGMNWKSPLEVGVRLINWVWAIDLIRDAHVFSDAEWRRTVNTVYRAMWDTQRKFSRGSSANNHLIGEVAGVFVAACYFPEMPNAEEWRVKSQRNLEREILAQTFADGCTREHAFGYQFFVIQFFTVCLLAGERSGHPFSTQFRERLHLMYRYMADICADTGKPPNFGDADDGYVLDLGERPAKASQLLTVGGYLFDDAEMILANDSESVYWLLGESTAAPVATARTAASVAYKEPGYFILRTGQRPETVPVRLFFDCAELGFGAIAAHGHADCLSFSLAVDGRELLVDPGTFDYFTYPEWRNYFRTTSAHNTLTVDGQDQSESLGPFIWGTRADARLIDWQDGEDAVKVTGEHNGYTRLPDPVVHRRTVTLFKNPARIEILDELSAARSHTLQSHFHVAPQCSVERLSDGAATVMQGAVRIRLQSNDGKMEVLTADDRERRGWISDGYHRRKAGHCIVLEASIDGASELLTSIEIG